IVGDPVGWHRLRTDFEGDRRVSVPPPQGVVTHGPEPRIGGPSVSLQFNIAWNGPAITSEMTSRGVRGLNQAAALLQSLALPRTHRDTGEFRRSLVSHPAHAGQLFSAVFSNRPYAVRQHEELGYRHKHGEAKFL